MQDKECLLIFSVYIPVSAAENINLPSRISNFYIPDIGRGPLHCKIIFKYSHICVDHNAVLSGTPGKIHR